MKDKTFLFFQKLFVVLAPLIWGILTWLIQTYAIDYSFRFGTLSVTSLFYFVIIAALVFLFGPSLDNASKKYQLYIDRYYVAVPQWRYFLMLVVIASCFLVVRIFESLLLQSLLYGIMFSSIIEEIITRSFFVKYNMKWLEFLCWNSISSLAFTLMHAFYADYQGGFYATLQNGHFPFSFMLGIIVYKTQRIEVAMILHMLSNILRYTIPVTIFHTSWPSPLNIFGQYVSEITLLLAVGFCYFKNKENKA